MLNAIHKEIIYNFGRLFQDEESERYVSQSYHKNK